MRCQTMLPKWTLKRSSDRMSCAAWMELMKATKITLFVTLSLLLGWSIDQLNHQHLNPELLNLGSFYLPRPVPSNETHISSLNRLLDLFIVQPHKNITAMQLLPNLTKLNWPEPVAAVIPAGIFYSNGTQQPLPKPFEPVMSQGQMSLSRKLLRIFSDLMFSRGYGNRFWINGGTLVGSFHHHDFIPWDDDIDVMADASLRQEIQHIFGQLGPEYEWYAMTERDKLFTKPLNNSQAQHDLEYSRATSDKPWPWPFLDIGYYQVGPTHTCEYLWRPGKPTCFPNSAIFPLIFRPFGKDWYPAPSNVPKYLRTAYRMQSSCVQFGYSHIFELGSSYARVPCYTLAGKYAFIRHNPLVAVRVTSTDATLSRGFILNHERLIKSTITGWKALHSLYIPIKEEVNICEGYGIPEPR